MLTGEFLVLWPFVIWQDHIFKLPFCLNDANFDLPHAQQTCKGFVSNSKHSVSWSLVKSVTRIGQSKATD